MMETICQKTRVDNNFLNFIKGPYEKAVGNIMFFGQRTVFYFKTRRNIIYWLLSFI